MPVEVKRDEVARVLCAIPMTDNKVGLVCSGIAIRPVVQLRTPPGRQRAETEPADYHNEHRKPNPYEPVKAGLREPSCWRGFPVDT